jgi:hypothetical protein
VSRSLRQPPSQDWPSLLLEAIQQRDASRALDLAPRCVHRQGMGALDTVLARADAASGQEGESRSWLMPLLKQGSPAAATPPAPSPEPAFSESPTPPLPTLTDPAPEAGVSEEVATPLSTEASANESTANEPSADKPSSGEASLSWPERPLAALSPLGSGASWPAAPFDTSPRSAPVTAAPPTAPASAPQSSTPISAPLPSERPEARSNVSASAALDQAFAPLEIAFPPLPSAPAVSAPLQAPSAPELSSPLGGAEPENPQESRESPANTPSFAPLDSGVGDDSDAVASRVDQASSQERLLEAFPTGQAAPVPTFQVDAFEDSASRPTRKPRQPERTAQEKAPAPRTLDAWRAWLPGPFRSRSRP